MKKVLVTGIVLALERLRWPRAVNLGSGKEISIRDLAEMIAAELV